MVKKYLELHKTPLTISPHLKYGVCRDGAQCNYCREAKEALKS